MYICAIILNNCWHIPQKLKIELSCIIQQSQYWVLENITYPREIKSLCWPDMCILMFIITFSTITKKCEQCKINQLTNGLKNMAHLHNGVLLSLKKNAVLSAWKELEDKYAKCNLSGREKQVPHDLTHGESGGVGLIEMESKRMSTWAESEWRNCSVRFSVIVRSEKFIMRFC